MIYRTTYGTTDPGGHLVGPQWDAEQVAELVYHTGPEWQVHDNMVTAVAIFFAECDGYINSYHDNFKADGKTIDTRDCGGFEINIPAAEIGQPMEKNLRNTEANPTANNATNLVLNQSTIKNNADAAYKLWQERGWEPWASYNSGIVFDDRYCVQAAVGVLNYSIKVLQEFQATVKDPARVANHNAPYPFLTIPEIRNWYPKIQI